MGFLYESIGIIRMELFVEIISKKKLNTKRMRVCNADFQMPLIHYWIVIAHVFDQCVLQYHLINLTDALFFNIILMETYV